MKGKHQGFTLIELVVVLVLLGIVGAAATARFQDMSTDAALVATRGVAAELSSASAINYAADVVNVGAGDVQLTAGAGTDCDDSGGGNDVEDLFTAGAPPNNYSIASTAFDCATLGRGATFTCTVNGPNGATADATIICL